MNPIASFLVFVCVLAGLAIGQWVNGYLDAVFLFSGFVILRHPWKTIVRGQLRLSSLLCTPPH
jgi:hypothetical protein